MNPILCAHCGPTKIVMDYLDGGFDVIPIRIDTVAPAAAVRRVSFLDPNTALVVYQDGSHTLETKRKNLNAGIVPAYQSGRWSTRAA